MTSRKLCDVWAAVDLFRPTDIAKATWKRTYEGVSAAIEYVGYKMITTLTEFDQLAVPKNTSGKTCYSDRKIVVSRDGLRGAPTMIRHLLSGNSSLQTAAEQAASRQAASTKASLRTGKGSCSMNSIETKTLTDLNMMCHMERYQCIELTQEHRLSDVAYSALDQNVTSEVFAADQVKTAQVTNRGSLSFGHHGRSIRIEDMVSILEAGVSLTMIGRDKNGRPDVVWLFDQDEGLAALKQLPSSKYFLPRLHLKTASNHVVTNICNQAKFRFDVGLDNKEVLRYRDRRIEVTTKAPKFSIEYLNEDMSQIPSPTHREEQRSFLMTRAACRRCSAQVTRQLQDSYGPIDFRLNSSVKIQDKVVMERLQIRKEGRYPYDPDSFDILQLTDMVNSTVYAIPMRVMRDNRVESFFSADDLMKLVIPLSAVWRQAHKHLQYDMKDDNSVKAYIDACKAAAAVPKLTNTSFHDQMVRDHPEKFGSKKVLALRRNQKT